MKSPVLLVILMALSCAHRDDSEIATIYENKWFSANREHSIESTDSKPIPHLFFDVDPQFVRNERSAHVVITSPARSPHAYGVDLPSGQRHYIHTYCEQKDVWKKSGDVFSRPDFSIGYLPRVLDQLGDPHKVLVFGSVSRDVSLLDTNYVKVRMVGAFVEQICVEGNCVGKNTWLSRLVFIAVDPLDRRFQSVASLKAFKKTVDWEQIKSQIENMDGRNPVGDFVSPGIRVRPLISYSEAFSYFKKRSIYFTPVELKRVQNGCHKLYDKFWKDVGEERPEDVVAKTTEELNAKLKVREELRAQKLPVGFSSRLRIFTEKYYSELKTCEKFVYHGNINQNPDKFWFLSYMGMYYRLHANGYYFDCARNVWEKNYVDDNGKIYFDPAKDIGGCSNKSIDTAMSLIPALIKDNNISRTKKYRFIDYDTHAFGTHRKLYQWTSYRQGRFECNEDPNSDIQRKINFSPEEASWKLKGVKDNTTGSELIY
jgi:hypothetical protein